jgi:hypothetical protein
LLIHSSQEAAGKKIREAATKRRLVVPAEDAVAGQVNRMAGGQSVEHDRSSINDEDTTSQVSGLSSSSKRQRMQRSPGSKEQFILRVLEQEGGE